MTTHEYTKLASKLDIGAVGAVALQGQPASALVDAAAYPATVRVTAGCSMPAGVNG